MFSFYNIFKNIFCAHITYLTLLCILHICITHLISLIPLKCVKLT